MKQGYLKTSLELDKAKAWRNAIFATSPLLQCSGSLDQPHGSRASSLKREIFIRREPEEPLPKPCEDQLQCSKLMIPKHSMRKHREEHNTIEQFQKEVNKAKIEEQVPTQSIAEQ